MTNNDSPHLCVDLPTGAVAICGADARDFLQGQLSNDVRKLGDELSQLTALHNVKGRVIALARLAVHEACPTLFLTPNEVEPVLNRLRMYVLRARVELRTDDTLSSIGIIGTRLEDKAVAANIKLPTNIDGVTTSDGYCAIHVTGDLPRYQIYGSAERLYSLRERLGEKAPIGGHREWQLADIRAGIPSITPPTRETFVAHAINLDLLDAVSFTKGCYTGQEIVARIQHRGRTKRRMFHMHATIDAAPSPGTAILADSRKAGQVVNAAADPGNGCELLGVIALSELSELDRGALCLDDEHQTPLRQLTLPYQLPNQ